MKRWLLTIIIIVFILTSFEVDAQCVMCKATAESAAESGERTVNGLNSGILYLMGIPYVLLGVIGFIFWKNRKKYGN